jgi:putative ABC transport system permease protein
MATWRRWLRRKREFEENMAAELEDHMDRETAVNMAAGMGADEARRRARLGLGAIEGLKESCREERKGFHLEALWSNARYGLRMLRRNPGFTTVVVLTLALGIGANSAVFSALDAVLLRPLPFPDGDQLMRISQQDRRGASERSKLVAPVRLEDWNRMNSTFQEITGYYADDASETSGALPERVTEAFLAPRFLQVWGIAPALGRDFTPDEERFGGPAAVLISDRYWRRHFDADPKAVGKKLRFGAWAQTVVGVMPASFLFPDRDVDLWTPVPLDGKYVASRDNTWYTAIGRLKPGVTLAEARANLATVQAQLGKQYPKPDADLTVAIQPLKETIVGGVRQSFWILFGSVSLLLLIACTNIVALLLARGSERHHEISVRFSLGASRGAVIGQLLTEVFLLALAGGGLGLFLAGAASKVFRALAGDLPRVEEIHLDARIVLYALACSVVVTLLCGLFPAIRNARQSLASSLAQSSKTQVSAHNRLQWLMVGVQVALAVTLLIGAGLLLRSFQAIGRVSPGFDTSHVLTFHVSGNYGETADMKGLTQRIDLTLDQLRSVPGVEATATAAALPGIADKYAMEIKFVEGETDPNRKIMAESRAVSPGYFAAMRIPLLSGELCREKLDRAQTEVLVNRSFADTFLPQTSPVGRHIIAPGNGFLPGGEIRGIVGDAREEGLDREPAPTIYWCISAPMPDPYYLVRTRTEPAALAQTIRLKIHQLEPQRSVFDVLPLDEHLDAAFGEKRLRMILLGFFAATAVSLACVGLYGTLSYSVTAREREVGLRLALGAVRGNIVQQFLIEGLGVCALGCLAGLGCSIAFTRLLSGMLYGVSPTDGVTFCGVTAIVLTVAAAASLIPAIRAAGIEPMQVLRNQ